MKRGEVYWVDLTPRSGSEQQGRRPAVVVSHDSFNSVPGWRSIIVVPLSTSSAQAARGPTVVPLMSVAGLSSNSVALCHQITTLDRSKLKTKIADLPAGLLGQVEAALKAALAIP